MSTRGHRRILAHPRLHRLDAVEKSLKVMERHRNLRPSLVEILRQEREASAQFSVFFFEEVNVPAQAQHVLVEPHGSALAQVAAGRPGYRLPRCLPTRLLLNRLLPAPLLLFSVPLELIC